VVNENSKYSYKGRGEKILTGIAYYGNYKLPARGFKEPQPIVSVQFALAQKTDEYGGAVSRKINFLRALIDPLHLFHANIAAEHQAL
jgi:hypothetical protein